VITEVENLEPGMKLETITHAGKLHSTLDNVEKSK
jgi:hypothetical protein